MMLNLYYYYLYIKSYLYNLIYKDRNLNDRCLDSFESIDNFTIIDSSNNISNKDKNKIKFLKLEIMALNKDFDSQYFENEINEIFNIKVTKHQLNDTFFLNKIISKLNENINLIKESDKYDLDNITYSTKLIKLKEQTKLKINILEKEDKLYTILNNFFIN